MPSSTPLRSARAFTLIELLVVLAIIAVLTALAIPALQGTSRAYQLDTTGQLVINQLTLARQSALSGSQLVQVRFYYLPDYNQSASASPSVYRAMQCFSEAAPAADGSIALTPLTKPIFFPAPVIISTTTVSPLLPTTPTTPTAAPAGTDPALPVYQMNYQYSQYPNLTSVKTGFHFKPDGSTDLTSPQNSITLVLENDKAGTTGLPNNYETIQIDPAIGTARRFLP